MSLKKPLLLTGLVLLTCLIATAISVPVLSAPNQLSFVSIGKDSGLFADTVVVKLLDAKEDVVCYVLAPERVSHRLDASGQALYEANSVGSISCVRRGSP